MMIGRLVGDKNGGGEIRTHETLAGLPVFKTGAFNRSATPPGVFQDDSRGGKISQKLGISAGGFRGGIDDGGNQFGVQPLLIRRFWQLLQQRDFAARFVDDLVLSRIAPLLRFKAPAASNVARHRLIDDLLRDVVRRDTGRRIFVLGAGFDTRAFRLPGGRWWEFDDPSLFELKEERLPQRTAPNPLLRQSIDFPRESLATRLGPLVSKAQRDRVASYIEKGKSEGARVVTGGNATPKDKGYFVEPTVFADVTTDMTIAQEEIFGPVLSILKYEDEDEALRIANDSIYGLAGGVWSGDAEKAKAFARKMKTGQIDINGGAFNVAAPFGGFKQSGVGRELGPFGLEEFTQPKSLQL